MLIHINAFERKVIPCFLGDLRVLGVPGPPDLIHRITGKQIKIKGPRSVRVQQDEERYER